MDHFLYYAARVVTTVFFIGLLGCVPVVAVSWISILKDEFKASEETKPAEAKR